MADLSLAVIAANRFGLGARPGDLTQIADDPRGWLRQQISPERSLPASLAALPSTVDDQRAYVTWLRQVFAEARAKGVDPAQLRPQAQMAKDSAPDAFSIESEFRKTFIPRYARAVKARFDCSVASERPFFERLVHFWVNHFVVSGKKPAAIALPPSFERDAIRPHITGTFETMLLAVTKHPAMLLYLDNYRSIGANSKVGRDPSLRAPKDPLLAAQGLATGLNENLAREILELHTLGVRSGYSQADVTAFAKIITGWTIARAPRVTPAQLALQGRLNGPGLFEFDDETHEPGPQSVLGKTYSQSGVDQGEAVLRDLAHHPATAHFISTKLARHFVADDPPPALVERLATNFRQSGGNLAEVYATLIDSPEPFQDGAGKFKTPEEFVTSAARACGANPDAGALLRALASMGQTPYNPPGPDGWPDLQAEWLTADSLWKRFEWAEGTAQAVAGAASDPGQLARAVLGPSLSPATFDAITRAESPVQGLTLLLASAEFQRR